jgi:hypothetical protein
MCSRYAQLVPHKDLSFIFLPFEGFIIIIIMIIISLHCCTPLYYSITIPVSRFYTIFNEFR